MANEIHEYARNYEQCFLRVKLKSSGQPRAYLLRTLGTNAATGEREFLGEIITRTLAAKSLTYGSNELLAMAEPLIAASGFVNVQLDRPTALYVSVDPDRQYRKAFGLDGSAEVRALPTGSPAYSAYLSAKIKGFAEAGKAVDEYTLICRAVAHQLAIEPSTFYPGVWAALGAVEGGGAASIAFSRHFAVSLRDGYKVPFLWRKDKVVGLFEGARLKVFPEALPFNDFFVKRFGIKMEPLSA